MSPKSGCRGPHRILRVEQWTGMGAICSCLVCQNTFHLGEPEVERMYTGFTHIVPLNEGRDIELLILDEMLGE